MPAVKIKDQNGNFIKVPTVRGEQGEQGIQGIQGEKGDTGDPFLYTDFTPEQLEALKVKGDKGDKGDKGEQGLNGADGADGADGANGADGLPAKINGVNTLEIVAGENITIDQIDTTMTINSSGGGASYIAGTGLEIVGDTIGIANRGVGTLQIALQAVQALNLANNSIGVVKIMNNAVTIPKLGADVMNLIGDGQTTKFYAGTQEDFAATFDDVVSNGEIGSMLFAFTADYEMDTTITDWVYVSPEDEVDMGFPINETITGSKHDYWYFWWWYDSQTEYGIWMGTKKGTLSPLFTPIENRLTALENAIL